MNIQHGIMRGECRVGWLILNQSNLWRCYRFIYLLYTHVFVL